MFFIKKDLTLRFYFVWWQQGHNRHDIQVRWNLKSFWCKFQNAKTWKKGLLIGYETHPPKKWTVWVVTAAGMNHAESFWLDIWLQAASVAAFPSGDHRLWYGYNLPPKSTDCRGWNYNELEAHGNHIYEPPILQSKHVGKYNTSDGFPNWMKSAIWGFLIWNATLEVFLITCPLNLTPPDIFPSKIKELDSIVMKHRFPLIRP